MHTMPTFTPTCPRCGGSVTLPRPCPNCGLGFLDRAALCDRCNQPFGVHIFTCQPAAKLAAGPILCPLCGAKRHYKDATVSRKNCAWRQWAMSTNRVPADAEPTAVLPDQSDPKLLSEFNAWLAAHPDLEAGSVPAERILRQRARERRLNRTVTES